MAQNHHSSDFIGREPINKLLIKFSTPAIISTTINSLYNIVDRLYIGRGVGADAQAGLALTFPIMIILMAFGMLVGMGSSAVTSILLGEKKQEEAERVVGQALAMFLIFIVVAQMPALIFLDKLLALFGGTPQAIPYAHDYLAIILWGSVFQHISFGMSNLVRSEGNPYKSMLIILLGAVTNIILDPIFIFNFKMGIKGAALATVLSMICSSCWILIHFRRRQGVLKLYWHNVRIFPGLAKKVVSIGMAPCLMQFVHCAVVVVFNISFVKFAASEEQATLGIGAFGIANCVIMCMLMPAFGIMQGMQPVVGYNHGARLFGRVRSCFRRAMYSAFSLSVLVAIIVVIFAPYIVLCFSKDESFNEIATYALRVCTFGFPFIAPGMLTGNYFQAIGRASLAIVLSLGRQCIILLPILFVMPRLMGMNGIWWAGPMSDTISGLICFCIFFWECKKLKAQANMHIAK